MPLLILWCPETGSDFVGGSVTPALWGPQLDETVIDVDIFGLICVFWLIIEEFFTATICNWSTRVKQIIFVPYGLSLTPVQNKYYKAAQVWDNNCGGAEHLDSSTLFIKDNAFIILIIVSVD